MIAISWDVSQTTITWYTYVMYVCMYVCVCVCSRVYCCPYKPHGLREGIITSTQRYTRMEQQELAQHVHIIECLTEAQSCLVEAASRYMYNTPQTLIPVASVWSWVSKVSGRLVGMMHNQTNVMYIHIYMCTPCMYMYSVLFVSLLKDTPP